MSHRQKILIVSNGPVPIIGSSVVEGGGIRCWTLFQGLTSHKIECVIAVPKIFDSPETDAVKPYENVIDLLKLAEDCTAVIFNYASGNLVLELFEKLPKNIIRIADLYVPIHIEVAAREVSDEKLLSEVLSFQHSAYFWEKTLLVSDLFIVASAAQRHYYLGLLAGIHALNPENYRDLQIIEVPQGPIEKPFQVENIKIKNTKTILWWGGFYPWFDASQIRELAEVLAKNDSLVKIQVVGGSNPFVTNKFFLEHIQNNLELLKGLPNVEILPWVPYADRESIFANVDAILMMNKMGFENELSFRTRLIDVVEFAKPLISNGGDPFSEKIIDAGGGFKVENSAKILANFISNELSKSKIMKASDALLSLRNELNSHSCIADLVDILKFQSLTKTKKFQLVVEKNPEKNKKFAFAKEKRISLVQLITFTTSFARVYGIKTTLLKIINKFNFASFLRILKAISSTEYHETIMKSKSEKFKLWFQSVTTIRPSTSSPNLVIIFHQIDRSGATLIGVEIAKLLSSNYKTAPIILTPNVQDPDLLSEIEALGLNVRVINPLSNINRILRNNDVLINSCAVPSLWISESLSSHNSNNLRKIGFFVHENEPDLFLNKKVSTSLKKATTKGLRIFTPSKGTQSQVKLLYSLGIDSTIIKNKVECAPSKPLDYTPEFIDLVIVGPTVDTRKRQLDILFAVHLAQNKTVGAGYRKIRIKFLGITNDTIGEELRRLATELLLPESYKIMGRLPKKSLLYELSECNVVVSLAINESFGLYIAEAMSAGAVVVRTKISGFEETVDEGINGYGIEASISELASVLEFLADKSKMSNEELLLMMKHSQEKVKPFMESNFSPIIELFQEIPIK